MILSSSSGCSVSCLQTWLEYFLMINEMELTLQKGTNDQNIVKNHFEFGFISFVHHQSR